MVEVRQLVVLAAHAAAAVEQEDDLLITFVLILAGDGGALACGGLPVDLAQGVAVAKLAQLMELQAQAATGTLAHAELAEPVVHRLELRAVEAREVGVDAALTLELQHAPGLPQAQRAGQQQLAAGEVEVTAYQRLETVADARLLAGMQADALRQVLECHALGDVIEHLDLQRLGEVVMGGQLHLAPAAERQIAWQFALQPRRGALTQPEAVDDRDRRQRQRQAPGHGEQALR